MTLLTVNGAGDLFDGAGTDAACSSRTWGEAAWTARDLYDAEPPVLRSVALAPEPLPEVEDVELELWQPTAAVSVVVPRPRRRRGNGRLKVALTMLMLTGAVASFLPGTFASFSAETTNPASTIASGTLTMSNQVNGATACISSNAPAQDNINPGCDTMITLANVAPGISSSTATALVTVKNTGSIDASKLWMWAPSITPTLTTPLTSGGSVSALQVTALKSGVAAGQAIVVKNAPSSSQTFYASSAALANATTISVTTQTANATYPIATSTVQVVDCYDAKTSGPPAGAPNATFGTQLNYNPTTGNPMCGAVLLYVQEVTGMTTTAPSTQNYCWSGLKYSSGGAGMCVAPIAVTLSGPITGSNPALPVSQLNGNVRSGDQIVVTPTAGTPQTFTASADVYAGAISIPTTGTVTGTLASASAVTDSTADATGPLAKLNADVADTLTNFDTLHDGKTGPIQMPPSLSNGTLGATTLTQLTHDTARTFLVGVFMPAPTGSNQNPLQGLSSKFGLTWHVDQ